MQMVKENFKKVHIKGGEVFITDDARKLYRVRNGTVMVYLLPLVSGKRGKRFFLAEFETGSIIPGFAADEGKDKSYRFALVALDEAEFEEITDAGEKAVDEARSSFAGLIGIKLSEKNRFEDEVIELYNLNSVKDEGYIYKAGHEAENTRAKNLKMIRDVLSLKGNDDYDDAQPTGNLVYDCAAFLCKKENMQIAPKEKVEKSSGRKFFLDDIARVSHFSIRQIELPDKWYKKDCGRFMAFNEDSGDPVCLFPKHYGKYIAYDVKNEEYIKVDAKYADGLRRSAVMFYGPFPDEKVTLFKLIRFGLKKVYPSDVIRIVILSIAGVLTGLLVPYLHELVYDQFIPLGDTDTLLQIGLVILACALGNLAFTVVKNLSVFRAMSSMEYAVQSATIDRLFNLPESFLRQYEAAVLGMRVMSISEIYSIISENVVTSLLAALFSLVYLTRMVGYSRELTAVAFVMLTVFVWATFFIGFKQIRYEREKTEVDQKASSDMFQFINGIEKVKISSSENRALLQYLGKLIRSRHINLRKERLTVLAGVIMEASGLLFSIAFYFIMIRNDLNLSIGAFMGFMSAFGALCAAAFEIARNFLVYNQVQPMYELARPILETPPESSEDARVPDELTGEIEINNVSFSYSEDAAPVLSDINLHFKSGEYVGIVGTSGSGKSTFLKLLMGYEKPQVGRIYYDGQDIDDLDKRELRKRFGVVLQEGGLIGGNIYENITITAPNCSLDRVKEVIRQVGLEKDIEEMPMGLQTVVNEEGGTLSGGQIQRILIARAIVGKPRIIFLDEATSAMDNVTQHQVIETLEKLDATKIVIAHRLSTVVNCDRIIVMDNGHIVEEGSYKELMEKKGKFYELAIRQVA